MKVLLLQVREWTDCPVFLGESFSGLLEIAPLSGAPPT